MPYEVVIWAEDRLPFNWFVFPVGGTLDRHYIFAEIPIITLNSSTQSHGDLTASWAMWVGKWKTNEVKSLCTILPHAYCPGEGDTLIYRCIIIEEIRIPCSHRDWFLGYVWRITSTQWCWVSHWNWAAVMYISIHFHKMCMWEWRKTSFPTSIQSLHCSRHIIQWLSLTQYNYDVKFLTNWVETLSWYWHFHKMWCRHENEVENLKADSTMFTNSLLVPSLIQLQRTNGLTVMSASWIKRKSTVLEDSHFTWSMKILYSKA